MDIQDAIQRIPRTGTSQERSSFDCPNCEDKGYIAYRSDSGEIMCRTCPCQIRKANLRRIRNSGLSGLIERCTLETYQTVEPWQKKAKDSAEAYIADWRGKWFYAGGSPGSGKTHLCTAICGAMMDGGLPVRYVQWRSDIPAIKAKANDAEAYAEAMQPLKNVRVLYIDDFLKGNVTEADRNIAFELLNARYVKPDCATIISSERTVGDVLDWDEAVGSRIAERAKGFIVSVSGAGKNWRLR